MSGNKFQIKRTGIAGRKPNIDDSSNSAFIDIGELALNFTDQILYTTDGNTLFEVGSNVTNQTITGGISANGSFGSNGQVLFTDGSNVYWADDSIVTDESLVGEGIQSSPLRIHYVSLEIDTRNSGAVTSRLSRLLEVFFRYDGSFRDVGAKVFTRNSGIVTITPV